MSGLKKMTAGIKTGRQNKNNLSYVDDTTGWTEVEELIRKMKMESKKYLGYI